MIDVNDISTQMQTILDNSDSGSLADLNNFYQFMLPPNSNFPSAVIIPFNETIEYYPSKYIFTTRNFNIQTFDYQYNKRNSRENTIRIVEDIKSEFENNFNLDGQANYVNLSRSNVTSSQILNDKFLSNTRLDFEIGVRDKLDAASYVDFFSIQSNPSTKEIKDKLINILINDNNINYVVSNITDVNSSKIMNNPALIVDVGDENYVYNYGNCKMSVYNTKVLLLTNYYFKQEAFEFSVDLLEGVKKTLFENYTLDGLSHFVRVNSVNFDIDRFSDSSDFFQYTNLDLSIHVKES